MKIIFFVPALVLALFCQAGAEVVHFAAKQGLPEPMITALATNGNYLWSGGNHSLAVKTKDAQVFSVFSKNTIGKVIAIVPQTSSALVATDQGFFQANAKTMSLQPLALPQGISGKDILFLKQAPDKNLWMGTSKQLYRSPENRIKWQTVNVPKEAGMLHQITFSGTLLLAATENQSVYLYDTVHSEWMVRFPLSINSYVTAMSLYGTTLYVGSNGEGIFHLELQNMPNHLIDTLLPSTVFTQAGACNGEIAWFGTFNALFEINQKTGVLKECSLPFPDQSSINCLALDSDRLYVGTEFGILAYPLEKPRITLETQESVCFNPDGNIVVFGSSPQITKASLHLEYANLTLNSVWFSDYLSLDAMDNTGQFNGQWNITNLPVKSNFYLLRASGTDGKGRNNSVLLPILIASEKPSVVLDSTQTEQPEGLRTFTGTFNTPFVDSIAVTPGDMTPEIALQKRTFRATATLKPGNNNVRAILKDWFGRQAENVTTVVAAKKPTEDAVIVKAGREKGEEIIVLSEALVFDLGRDEIKPSGLDALERVANYMQRDKSIMALIVGHTDNLPIATRQFANNLVLSKARAQSVFEYLSQTKRLAPDRFTIDGKGESQPIADNNTKDGRRKNRRVEIVLKKVE